MKKTNKGLIISDEEFLDLFEKGHSQAEICKITGISPAQASRRCKKLNLDSKKNSGVNYSKIKESEFLELYNDRKSDAEIARIFKCSSHKVRLFRESLKLPIVDRKHFTDVEFQEIYYEGYTDKELSEIFKVSNGYIIQRRNKLNLAPHSQKIQITPLTDQEFQVILGTVLGDTHLYKRYENGHTAGTCNHCVQQKEWIFKKYEYLKNIANTPKLIDKYDIRFLNPNYQQWYFYIRSNPALDDIYVKFYKNKKKYINKNLFSQIEALGLATWYMDDGSKYQDYGGYLLCTHSFSEEDLKILQEVLFFKFNINTSLNANNGLYILNDSKQTFKNLIEPYIIETMKYKL